jgi:hypothetical protein
MTRPLRRLSSKLTGPRIRRGVVLLSAALVLTIAMLAVLRRPTVRAHIQVTTAEVRFSVGGQAMLADGLRLSELLAAGLSSLEGEGLDEHTPAEALRLRTLDGGEGDQGIWSQPIVLSPGAVVDLGREPRTGRTRLTLAQSGGSTVSVAYTGPVELARDTVVERPASAVPAVLTLRSRGPLDLLLRAPDPTACIVCTPMPIPLSAVEFVRVDTFRHGLNLVDQKFSQLESAEVAFDDLPGKSARLSARQELRLGIDRATLRRLRAGPAGQLVLEIDGHFHRIETGEESDPLDLRPTWLAWMLAREAPVAIWTGAIYLCGLLAGLGTWLEKKTS